MSESVTLHFKTVSALSIDEAEKLVEAVLWAVADYSADGGLSGLGVSRVDGEYGRAGICKRAVRFDAAGRPVAESQQ